MSDTRRPFWETPRNLVVILGAAAALSGYLGYTDGQAAAAAAARPYVVQVIFQPGAIVLPATTREDRQP